MIVKIEYDLGFVGIGNSSNVETILLDHSAKLANSIASKRSEAIKRTLDVQLAVNDRRRSVNNEYKICMRNTSPCCHCGCY